MNALTVIERAELALDATKTAADLRALVAQSQSITAVTNKDGRDECHRAAMVAKAARIAVEKTSKEARDEATRFCKGVISIERDLVGIIEPEESRLITLRNEWDDARAAERAAAEQAEKERVATIRLLIDAMRDVPLNVLGQNSQQIAAEIAELESVAIDDKFGEFGNEAGFVRNASLSKLQSMKTTAELAEAEAVRVAKMLAEERAKAEVEQAAIRSEEERQKAAQQAEIARQQAIIAAAERAQREAEEKEESERKRRAKIAALTPPSAFEIVQLVSDHYSLGDVNLARYWLDVMDFSA